MDETNLSKINPNTADIEILTQIPGIGPELAQRIIAGKPYTAFDDLRRVSGIGPKTLDRFLPYLTFTDENEYAQIGEVEVEPIEELAPEAVEALETGVSAAEAIGAVETEAPVPETIEAAEDVEPAFVSAAGLPVEEDELEAPSEPFLEPTPAEPVEAKVEALALPEKVQETPEVQPSAPEKKPPVTQEKWISRNQTYGLMFVGFVTTLILGLLLALGILAAINQGQLVFATPAQVNTLTTQAERLDSRVSTLEQDLEGLRARIDNMETLNARVSQLEENTTQLGSRLDETASQLKSDFDNISAQVSGLSEIVDAFGTQIDELQTQGDQFMSFLNGLQELLNNITAIKDGSK